MFSLKLSFVLSFVWSDRFFPCTLGSPVRLDKLAHGGSVERSDSEQIEFLKLRVEFAVRV